MNQNILDDDFKRSRSKLRLDLGSGPRPLEGFVGVDIAALENVVAFDLVSGDKWPWQDNSVDELASSHFIEHIPADYVEVMRIFKADILRVKKDRLLFFFDEAFRVIADGGLFHLTWPALKSTDAFRDPTHRRFLPLEFLHYLSVAGRAAMGLQHYEATCNWVAASDTHVSLEHRPEGSEPWHLDDVHRIWDVQRAFTVTLRAEK